MNAIEKRVLEFIALATPNNSNMQPCGCNVRPVAQAQVQKLVRALESYQPAIRIPGQGTRTARIVPNPAPWVQKMVSNRSF